MCNWVRISYKNAISEIEGLQTHLEWWQGTWLECSDVQGFCQVSTLLGKCKLLSCGCTLKCLCAECMWYCISSVQNECLLQLVWGEARSEWYLASLDSNVILQWVSSIEIVVKLDFILHRQWVMQHYKQFSCISSHDQQRVCDTAFLPVSFHLIWWWTASGWCSSFSAITFHTMSP